MIRIGICDDSAEARQGLHSVAERVLEKCSVEYDIFEYSSGEGLLHWLEKHAGELDLVFLDIEMSGMNGMEAAKAIRELGSNVLVAFVTGFDDYVFDGYSVGALGYVMKPPQAGQIEDILSRALGALFSEGDKVFLCRNSEGLYRIPKQSVLYFYSDRRQVTCVTDVRQYTFYDRLDNVMASVGTGFVRIHQRYLVRARAVEQVEGSNVIIRGQKLPISRSCQSATLAAIARAALE